MFEYQDRALHKVNFESIFSTEDPLIPYVKTKNPFGSLSENPIFLDDLRNALHQVDDKLHIMFDAENREKY